MLFSSRIFEGKKKKDAAFQKMGKQPQHDHERRKEISISTLLILAIAPIICGIILMNNPATVYFSAAIALQSLFPVAMFSSTHEYWKRKAWDYWEQQSSNMENQDSKINGNAVIPIPILNANDFLQCSHASASDNNATKACERRMLESLDLSKPLLMTNAANTLHPSDRKLSIAGMMQPPLKDLNVHYFSDARKGLLSPDRTAPLGDIVHNITTSDGNCYAKIGSQIPVHSCPELMNELSTPLFTKIFGDRFKPSDLSPFLGIQAAALTTVPIFLAGGDATQDKQGHARTDLHSEPIGNIAVQLEGEKSWILVDPSYTPLLRPTIAADGRAFFHSAYDPSELPKILKTLPHYEVLTKPGDALWIPTWFWHRVDYVNDGVSFGASLFHFRPMEYFRNNPLFCALIVPNLTKELAGFKFQ